MSDLNSLVGLNSSQGTSVIPEMDGDQVIAADGGSSLLIGREGLVVLQAGSNARLVMGKLKDFIHLYCREFKICSDFGEIGCSGGSGGRQGFYISGGGTYSESNPGDTTNTAKIFVGDVNGNTNARIGMCVGNPDGEAQGAICFDNTGKLQMVSQQDAEMTVGKNMHIKVEGAQGYEITGDRLTKCKDQQTQILGKEEKTIAGQKTQNVSADYTLNVTGTLVINASGIVLNSVGGGGQACDLKCSSFNISKV